MFLGMCLQKTGLILFLSVPNVVSSWEPSFPPRANMTYSSSILVASNPVIFSFAFVLGKYYVHSTHVKGTLRSYFLSALLLKNTINLWLFFCFHLARSSFELKAHCNLFRPSSVVWLLLRCLPRRVRFQFCFIFKYITSVFLCSEELSVSNGAYLSV